MIKKRGLGKSLDALLVGSGSVMEEQPTEKLSMLPI